MLDHRGVATPAGYGAGWHAHVDVLQALVTGSDRPPWNDLFQAVLPEYEAQVSAAPDSGSKK